ncbi:hypothetical protein GCM10010495_82790 [Kitasatospora herbaricolor]|nr:hypothetical protein GCM10010495_82790 [Kitasatospora herbaricolor]
MFFCIVDMLVGWGNVILMFMFMFIWYLVDILLYMFVSDV